MGTEIMKKWIVILICAFMWSQDYNEINFMLGDINQGLCSSNPLLPNQYSVGNAYPNPFN